MVESILLIFVGAAALAAVALFTRQPLIVAYVAIGCLLGPYGLGWTPDADALSEIGEIGIIFLLFLVGLDLPPNKLKDILGNTTITAIASSAVFFAVGFTVVYAFGFDPLEAVIAGIAAMFSSTILGIKLLPTTVLHHQHIGEIVIGLLLLQDLIAIIALLALASLTSGEWSTISFVTMAAAVPALIAAGLIGVRLVILPLLGRFDAFHEFIFLLAIGWCLGFAYLAHNVGLTYEIGAFVAGVSLAILSLIHI